MSSSKRISRRKREGARVPKCFRRLLIIGKQPLRISEQLSRPSRKRLLRKTSRMLT